MAVLSFSSAPAEAQTGTISIEDASERRVANRAKFRLVERELAWIRQEEEIANGLYVGGFLGFLASFSLAVGSFTALDSARQSGDVAGLEPDAWLAIGVGSIAVAVSSLGVILTGAGLDIDANCRRDRLPPRYLPTFAIDANGGRLGVVGTF